MLNAEMSISHEPVMSLSLSLNVALRVQTGRRTQNTYGKPLGQTQTQGIENKHIKMACIRKICSYFPHVHFQMRSEYETRMLLLLLAQKLDAFCQQ